MGSVPRTCTSSRAEASTRPIPPAEGPPAHPEPAVHPQLHGSDVYLWFPGRFMVGAAPADVYVLRDGETPCFTVPDTTVAGVYSYAAYVVAAKEFVEGNTPPDIIIDK